MENGFVQGEEAAGRPAACEFERCPPAAGRPHAASGIGASAEVRPRGAGGARRRWLRVAVPRDGCDKVSASAAALVAALEAGESEDGPA